MRTRPNDWFNTKTWKPVYGLQVQTADGEWMNLAEDGKPCLYTTKAKRDKRRAELRKLPAYGATP